MRLAALGFDADDTLWHNERFFKETEARFAGLLSDHAEPREVQHRLIETERRNLALYGYGIKGFALSMIETAASIVPGGPPPDVVEAILGMGRDMLRHPVDLLPHAYETIRSLSESHTLVLVTKGDLFDQERKLEASGLAEFFHGVEIVSEKTRTIYEFVFERHGRGAEQALMVGNSLRSDIHPALEAGAHAVHVPHRHEWELERADVPVDNPRFHHLDHLGEMPALIERIEAGIAA